MPIVLGNTTITGLGVGGLPAGTVNATTLADASVTKAKLSGIKPAVAIHTFTNSTRQVTSSSSNYTYFTFTLTKVSASSTLFFHGFMPGFGNTNSGEYIGIGIDGTMAYGGISNVDIGGQSGNFTTFTQIRTGIGSGSRSITIQAIPADGTSNRTVDVINPNSSDDGRNRQLETTFIIYEVETA